MIEVGDYCSCQYVEDGIKVRTDIRKVIKIADGKIHLLGGIVIDADTGIEDGIERVWMKVESTQSTTCAISKAKAARKWIRAQMAIDEQAIWIHETLCNPVNGEKNRRFFNRMYPEQKLAIAQMPVSFIMDNFQKPPWCGHPYALSGCFGCKKLLDMEKMVTRSSCSDCQFFVAQGLGQLFRRLRLFAGMKIGDLNTYLDIYDYGKIEADERPATEREVAMLERLYAMPEWTYSDAEYFLLLQDPSKMNNEILSQYRLRVKQNFFRK